VFHQSNPNARKSSRGSSNTTAAERTDEFPSVVQPFDIDFPIRAMRKTRRLKENESAFSSSSMSAVCRESHLYSAANTAAPSTFKKPCIFVCTSSRNMRSG